MTIDRRTFVQTATVIAVAAAGTQAAQAQPSALSQATTAAAAAGAADPNGLPDLSSLDPKAPPAPRPDGMAAPSMRRFDEQRWILDNIIRANGIDWDQPRLPGLAAALGPEATTDIAAIRTRVQKFADIAPAFEAVARRREARAIEAAKQEDKVGARDNFFMAANFWGGAQWPIDENNAKNIFFNQKKRECYLKYAKLADHQVEPAWIALDGKSLPGWFHLPYGYQAGQRVPCVVSIPGMDGYKERSVPLAGDRFLSRGIAVLVVEGPGQYESAVLGVRVSIPAWQAAGPAMFNWLANRAEIDAGKIAIIGSSFGSLFSTIAASAEPRYVAVAVASTCLEPGCDTIFQQASPTFKKRFMYMSGIPNEDAVRQIPPDADVGGPHRQDQGALSVPGRRGRRALPARAHRADVQGDEDAAAARHLRRFASLGGRRSGGQSGTGPEQLYRGMDRGAARRHAVRKRTLVRRAHRPGREEPVGVSIALGWSPNSSSRECSTRRFRPTLCHLGAALKVLICSITGFHSACSVRM